MRENTSRVRKVNLPMVLAGILFYFVIVTTYLSGGLLARYTTSDTSSDSARVIKFGQLYLEQTNAQQGGTSHVVTPERNIDMKVTVSFGGSEADTFVFVKVSAPKWERVKNNTIYTNEFRSANGKASWTVADGWTHVKTTGNEYVYYRKVESGNTLDKVDFIKNGIITIKSDIKNADLYAINEAKLDMTAYVVQANGFNASQYEIDNALDAWNSITN